MGTTLADHAYQAIKQGILRGEFAEGAFLSEADVTKRHSIGRTPFREACNRLHNEQLLEVLPRRGYFIPEMSFRVARDLLETRLILEGAAAELAAVRAEPVQVDELERLAHCARELARRNEPNVGELIENNIAFHLLLAAMSQNRQIEGLVRGLLERSTRLFYLAFRWTSEEARDVEGVFMKVVEAVRRHDGRAAREGVVEDITRGQLNILGRELWAGRVNDASG